MAARMTLRDGVDAPARDRAAGATACRGPAEPAPRAGPLAIPCVSAYKRNTARGVISSLPEGHLGEIRAPPARVGDSWAIIRRWCSSAGPATARDAAPGSAARWAPTTEPNSASDRDARPEIPAGSRAVALQRSVTCRSWRVQRGVRGRHRPGQEASAPRTQADKW